MEQEGTNEEIRGRQRWCIPGEGSAERIRDSGNGAYEFVHDSLVVLCLESVDGF